MEHICSLLEGLLVILLISEFTGWFVFYIDWKSKREYRNKQSHDRSTKEGDKGEDQGCSPMSQL